jgi:hypothetical protein
MMRQSHRSDREFFSFGCRQNGKRLDRDSDKNNKMKMNPTQTPRTCAGALLTNSEARSLTRSRFAKIIAIAVASFCLASGSDLRADPFTGAIFSTDTGGAVDLNIYSSKEAVYLNGGPQHGSSAGLPDGSYYVQVTVPDGTLLGTSIGSGNETPVHVTNGVFDAVYQLWALVIKTSDATQGYDDTTNGGGEYKVWVSPDAAFERQKTDNFKVIPGGVIDPNGGPTTAELCVDKYYDANANGILDAGDTYIDGWEFKIGEDIHLTRNSLSCMIVAPGSYSVTEINAIESFPSGPWIHTTATSVENITLAAGDHVEVEFGNVCIGAGGGLTLGFWSNKNGQAQFAADDLALMVALNLRDAKGVAFDPANYAAFRTWILKATATNMANMLSAQLAAMELNVLNGNVIGTKLVYAPQLLGFVPPTPGLSTLGFISVNALMADANASLGANGVTLDGSPDRAYQGALKNALDDGNNNKNFVQPAPSPFSFAP